MIRQTSLDAYRTICDRDLLSTARLAVYRHLFDHGPLTRNELDHGLAAGRPNPTYSRRLAEMERIGVLQRAGTRICSITGFRSELWDVTDGLPQKQPKAKVGRRRLETLLAEIRGEMESGLVVQDPAGFTTRWLGNLPLTAVLGAP